MIRRVGRDARVTIWGKASMSKVFFKERQIKPASEQARIYAPEGMARPTVRRI